MGKRHGYGTCSVLGANAQKYCGQWANGKKHGHGIYFYDNCATYEGQWSEGQRSGWGRMFFDDGDVYEGEWMKDKEHGLGIRRYANGNWYEGSWREGKKSGMGKLFYCDKGQLYRGLWVRGEPRCGTVEDLRPANCPIPQVKLVDVQMVLQEAQRAYFDC
ncbi:MORN repeat-containing protein 3 isoform X2 [Syngnathus acus]|nr:MORN repeat-containing protein 3 isoform X2 [Syngnathus acus]